jgi:polymorphic membrane protein
LTVTHSTFSGNSVAFFTEDRAYGAGGVIYNAGTLTVTYSTFSGNDAGNGLNDTGEGGAIYNVGTSTVTNCTFSGNSSAGDGDGGAIENGGILTVTNCTFSGNSLLHDGVGGAIENGGTLTVTNSTFSDNSANLAGGAIDDGGTLTVTNSTFSGNSAFDFHSGVGYGGAIASEGTAAVVNVINSSFVQNSAVEGGGGISNGSFGDSGTLTITNSTFSGNSVFAGYGFGGNIRNGNETAIMAIKSTILAASSSGGNCVGTIMDTGYNISDDSSCNFSATGSHNNTDPMLDPAGLSNNGGPTQTIALLSASPAIDAIPVANCTDQARTPNPIITDQRLFPRPDAEENLCDIGAYEFQDTAFVPFSRFSGSLTINSNTRVLNLNGRFKLGRGGSIDPSTQPVAFSVGQNALRLPVGSFVQNNSGYIYQKIGKSILRISIEFTNTPGSYRLLVFQQGGPQFTAPELVTLTIGDNSGSTLMNAKLD